MKIRTILSILSVIVFSVHAIAGDVFKDKTATPEARARDVLSRLSFEEKVALTGGSGMYSQKVDKLGLSPAHMADASQGIRLMQTKKNINITEVEGVEGENIVSVSFPGMLALAATWNPSLSGKFGDAMGGQCRTLGIDILLGPGINMYRTSAGGRDYEYMGEDPYLTSRIAVSYISGVQSKGVVATAKHFVANDTEFCRHFSSSEVDVRTLREIYLLPFQAAIQEAHVGAIMTGNHRVNGLPACMDKPLLQDIVRSEWGFNGIFMSDWHQTTYYQTDHPLVLASGHSLYMPNGAAYQKWLLDYYKKAAPEQQKILELQLDNMVVHNLIPLFASGFYDRGMTTPGTSPTFEAHKLVARETAEEAITLLKNEDNILPISVDKKILYIGDPEIYTGIGSGHVEGYDHTSYETGLREVYGKNVIFTTAAKVKPEDFKAADVVLCNVNKESGEGNDIPFEIGSGQTAEIEHILGSHDRVVLLFTACNGFNMPWLSKAKGALWCFYLGQERGHALADILSGKINPSGKLPMTIEKRFADSVDPEYNFLGGKPYWHGDISYREYYLTGKVQKNNLSPELEKIFIPNVKPGEILKVPYKEGIFMGYRWYDKQKIEPQFPFGFGLSYTTFKYEKIILKNTDNKDYPVTAIVTLKNSGKVEGKEVVQVYSTDEKSSVEQPLKELAGFVKVQLNPGESKTVEIPLTWSAFQFFDVKSNHWVLEPGEFIIHAGGSSASLPLQKSINL